MPPSPPHTRPGLPQTPGVPPPPQVEGALQVPHWSSPPQPSPAGPHWMLCCAQVSGVHALGVQTPFPQNPLQQSPAVEHAAPWAPHGGTHLPPLQERPAGQVHCRMPPQPSGNGPHWIGLSAQVSGVQPALPQTKCVPPPPQVSGAAQVPHWSRPPQPSPAGPQAIPWLSQVCGMQPTPAPQTPGVPLPPQVSGAGQVSPQSRVLPQPSPAKPQSRPCSAHVSGTQLPEALHAPFMHVSPATQATPQAPQLFGSVAVFVHAPPHSVQLGTHAPEAQTRPAGQSVSDAQVAQQIAE